MKRIRLDRWASQAQSPRNPRLSSNHQTIRSFSQHPSPRPSSQHNFAPSCNASRTSIWARCPANRRGLSDLAVDTTQETDVITPQATQAPRASTLAQRETAARRKINQSSKLAALHARLGLPAKLPLTTLARCLIDPSADERLDFNNAPLALLGKDLLGAHTAEYLLCKYPRLPMPVVFAAQWAYVGSATLSALRAEWGVEAAVAPGDEVDAGLLQFQRIRSPNSIFNDAQAQDGSLPAPNSPETTVPRGGNAHYRRGMSSRIVRDDEFGDLHSHLRAALDKSPQPGASISSATELEGDQENLPAPRSDLNAITLEAASASFVRAVVGALHLHAGPIEAKAFHKDHVLSRHLAIHNLIGFTNPTRDLSRLCAREGFEPPVARIISETGRHSRTPVFVVGVFSGNDKLGEGVGSSLNEGRVRAAVAALRSWYMYSPPDGADCVPSDVEHDRTFKWKPRMIDVGEVIT